MYITKKTACIFLTFLLVTLSISKMSKDMIISELKDEIKKINVQMSELRNMTMQHSQHDTKLTDYDLPEGLPNCRVLFREAINHISMFSDVYRKTLLQINNLTKATWLEGNSGSSMEQTLTYMALGKGKNVRTVCETGFNAGHSALAFLSVNPNIHMYSFDIGEHAYSMPTASLLQKTFPGRLRVTLGDSTRSLPQFANANPHIKCDVIIVDGGHSYEVAKSDLQNFRRMANRRSHILVIDDHPCCPDWCIGVGKAWEENLSAYLIQAHCQYFANKKRGFTVGKYINL